MKGKTCADWNPPLLYWGKIFQQCKIIAAVIVLFYLSRGLTIGQVMLLSAIWSVVSVLTEIPSGYLADRIGRRRTLLLGGLLSLIGWAVMFWADSLLDFVLVISFSAAAESFSSGTEEALLYDSLKESGREGEMAQRNSVLTSARTAAKVLFPLIGCLVAQDLEDWQFRLLIAADAILVAIALTFLWRLKEPARSDDSASLGERGIFGQSLWLIRRDPWLLKATFNRHIAFLGGFLLFRAYQPLLSGLGFSVLAIGLYYGISRGLITLLVRWAARAARLVGTARVLFMAAVIGAGLSLVAGLSGLPWLVFGTLLLAEVSISLREPLFAQAVNERLESGCRATALSGLNCLKEISSVPVMLAAGWLVQNGVSCLPLAAAGLAVVAVILLPVCQRELDRFAKS